MTDIYGYTVGVHSRITLTCSLGNAKLDDYLMLHFYRTYIKACSGFLENTGLRIVYIYVYVSSRVTRVCYPFF